MINKLFSLFFSWIDKHYQKRSENNTKTMKIDGENQDGRRATEEENFTLFDKDLLKPRIITGLPESYDSIVGAQVTFSCVTTVLFPVECEWYINGQFIDDHSTNGRIYFKNGNKEIVILSLSEDDQGTLIMVAKNRFGKAKTTCKLNLGIV